MATTVWKNKNLEMADSMRKTAEVFRQAAAEEEKETTVKCAQALAAAKGLAQLKRILGGSER